MGTKHNWTCTNEQCDTEVLHVSGGFDRGFIAKTQTRICVACKHINDYEVGVVSDPTHYTFTEAELEKHKNTNPKCEKCGNNTTAWDLKCPKCGSSMKRGAGMILWD